MEGLQMVLFVWKRHQNVSNLLHHVLYVPSIFPVSNNVYSCTDEVIAVGIAFNNLDRKHSEKRERED